MRADLARVKVITPSTRAGMKVRNELIDMGMPLDKAFGDCYMGKVSNGRVTVVL